MSWRTTLVRWIARLLFVTVDEAVDWDELDVGEHIDPVEYIDWDELSYEDLEEHLDERHYRDPVDDLRELPDDPDSIYYWECSTEEAATQITNMLQSHFKHELGRSPNAAHLVLTDVEQLRTLDPDELRVYTQPMGGDD